MNELPLAGRSAVCVAGVSRATTAAARLLTDLGAECVLLAGAGMLSEGERLLLARGRPVRIVAAADELPDGPDYVIGFGEHPSFSGPNTSVVELCWTHDGDTDGSDAWVQAMAGPTHVLGEPDREPLWFPYRMGEYIHGVNAVGLLCLQELLGGVGATARCALSDLWAYAAGTNWMLCVPKGIPFVRSGRRSPGNGGVYPQRLFRTRDGFATLLCRSRSDWAGFLKAVGEPDWSADERYWDLIRMGIEYPDEVDELVEGETIRFTAAGFFAETRKHGCPTAPVRPPDVAVHDEVLAGQGFWATTDGSRISSADSSPATPVLPGSLWREQTWRSAPRAPGPAGTAPLPTPGPDLNGWRVLDLSWIWAGPMVGSVLADLGADVIKVEHEPRLDNMRLRGRLPGGEKVDADPREIDPLFHNVNRGKRSLLLDMKSEGGREVFLDLVRQSHVVLESFRPHVLESWGIGYDDMAAVNPGIVLLSLRGLDLDLAPGASGLRSYAPITSSLSGLEHSIRYPGADDPTGGMAIGVSDPVAGWHGAMLVLAAMARRRDSGRGGWVRLSQLETLASVLPEMYLDAQVGAGDEPDAVSLRCADGDVLVRGPAQARESLAGAIGAVTNRTTDAVLAQARARGLSARLVLPVEEHVNWPEHTGRPLLHQVKHVAVGEEFLYSHGWRLGDRDFAPTSSAPLIGEHTDEVLAEYLGLDAAAIEDLRRRDVLR